MKNKLLKIAVAAGLVMTFALPLLSAAAAVAQDLPAVPGVDAPIKTVEDIVKVINKIIGYVRTFILLIAIFFVFYAAYLYLTAAGDPEKVKKASTTLIYAAVGIAVALVATGVQFIIQQLVRG